MNIVQTKNRFQPDVAYRKIDALNQSMIAVFDENPVQFYEEFILKNSRKDQKISKEMIIGTLTDFYVLDCKGDEEKFNQEFENHFHLYDGVKGSKQVIILADYLFDITKRDRNEIGEATTSFTERFKEALEKIQKEKKYNNRTFEWALEDFNNGEGKIYFDKLIENMDKQVVDMFMLEKSKFLTNQALTDSFVSEIFQHHGEMEDLCKFAIEFDWLGQYPIKCKVEVDKILIDHRKKIIYPKDIKCTFDNEMFEISYIKRKYYLQNAFYHLATSVWAEKNNMKDYHVEPMEFVVFDTSKNGRRPLRYQTTPKHLEEGMNGFTYRGYKNRGLKELINEISWASEMGVWNVSKTAYDNEGVIALRTFGE